MSKRVLAGASGAVEYRTIGEGTGTAEADEGKIVGLSCPFDTPTMIGEAPWGFRESFAPGAFTKTLLESDIVALDNHDTSKPIARKSAGTLTLRQTDRGLEYEATPADTSYVRDLIANIKSGNIRGCSFGFQAVKEDWLDDDGQPSNCWEGTQRIVREAKLFEVSPCTFPAYGTTEIGTRDAVSAARGAERREKYNADDKQKMLAKGHAIKNADGEASYPIEDEEDLKNAVHAVGRGGADHDAIRKYVIGRAKDLGLSDLIPDNWNADGSLKETNSAELIAELRARIEQLFALLDERDTREHSHDGDALHDHHNGDRSSEPDFSTRDDYARRLQFAKRMIEN